MTTTRPLAGPEAQIFDGLQRLIALGRRNRSWDVQDVVRVVNTYLIPGSPRKLADFHQRRADKAERRVEELKMELARVRAENVPTESWSPPPTRSPRRVGVVTPMQAEVLSEMCKGRRHVDIARDLKMSRGAVDTAAWRAAHRIGADRPIHAVVLILTGQVEVRVKEEQRATG